MTSMETDNSGQSYCRDASPKNSGQGRVGPRELRIELTHDCPLRCRHCSACSEAGDSMHLPTEVVITAVKDFLAMGGEKVVLTGGEPLVYPDLMKILDLMNESGVKPIIFTSGITYEIGGYRSAIDLEILRLSQKNKAFRSGQPLESERHAYVG